MNKERREELLEVTDLLEDAIACIEAIKCDEEDAYSSLPEGLMYSSRGQDMQDAIDMMDGFIDTISKISGEIADYATPKKKKAKPKLIINDETIPIH